MNFIFKVLKFLHLGAVHKERSQSEGKERLSSADILRTRGFFSCGCPNF